MASKVELDLQGMLLSTGLVQPVKITSWGGKLSALCRLVPGQEAAWLKLVELLLVRAGQYSVNLHLCKQFLVKDDRMVAGWHVGFEEKSASQLKKALDRLAEVFASGAPELASVPDRVPAPVAPPATKAAESIPSDEEEDEEPVPETADIVARRRAYMAKTSAAPRSPPPAPEVELPALDPAAAAKKIVQRTMAVDSKGRSRQVVVEEMPLPGVFTDDMNKPNEKNKGATKLG